MTTLFLIIIIIIIIIIIDYILLLDDQLQLIHKTSTVRDWVTSARLCLRAFFGPRHVPPTWQPLFVGQGPLSWQNVDVVWQVENLFQMTTSSGGPVHKDITKALSSHNNDHTDAYPNRKLQTLPW